MKLVADLAQNIEILYAPVCGTVPHFAMCDPLNKNLTSLHISKVFAIAMHGTKYMYYKMTFTSVCLC